MTTYLIFDLDGTLAKVGEPTPPEAVLLLKKLEEKGARIGYALISNHAFVDGNKRIGMYVLLTFLEVNGIRIYPSEEEVVRVGLEVASGKMKYEELLEWILDNK